jgi:hypothetical protein
MLWKRFWALSTADFSGLTSRAFGTSGAGTFVLAPSWLAPACKVQRSEQGRKFREAGCWAHHLRLSPNTMSSGVQRRSRRRVKNDVDRLSAPRA